MIELLDYDIFHTQEGVRKDDQLCNIFENQDHVHTQEELMRVTNRPDYTDCKFTINGFAEEHNEISKTKKIYVKNKAGKSFPKTVPKTISDNLKEKTYIKFGEMCSICFEPIISRKNAMITQCKHAFHKNCLKDWFLCCIRIQDNERLDSVIWNYVFDVFEKCVCPLCRGDTGMHDLEGECTIGDDVYNYKGERELVDKYHLMYRCCPITKFIYKGKWQKIWQ